MYKTTSLQWLSYCNDEKTDKDAKNPKYMNEF